MTEPRANRQSLFENALAELRAGRIERAEVLCDRILTSAPRDPAAHQLAATIALRRGRLDDAARWANSSLDLRPDHSPTLVVAARVARAAGNIAPARMWLDRRPLGPRSAGACFPDLRDAHRVRAMGKPGQFSKTSCSVFQTSSTGGEIGEALRKSGHPETAVLAFARAAESSADPMDAARLGAALQTINRPLKAIVDFRRALAAAPDLAEARVAIGTCLRQTGELQVGTRRA